MRAVNLNNTRAQSSGNGMGRIVLLSVLGTAFSLLPNTTYSSDKASKITLSRKYSSDYASLYLPSRTLGVGLKDTKSVPNDLKFQSIGMSGEEGFDDKYHALATIGNIDIALFLEYEKERPGKSRQGKLYFGPSADLIKRFWQAEYTGREAREKAAKAAEKDKGKKKSKSKSKSSKKKGDADKNEAPPEPKTLSGRYKLFLSTAGGSVKPGSKRKGVFTIKNGRPRKGKHYLAGELEVMPHGLGQTENYQYWNCNLAKPGAIFDVSLTDEWAFTLKNSRADRYKLAVIYPSSKTHLNAYLRSATALTGTLGKDKMEITLFDDNLNGQFGEVGVDSIMIGEALTIMSETISVGKDIYDLEVTQKDEKTPASMTATPNASKTGRVRLTWDGSSGSEIHMAIIKAKDSRNYFGLVNPTPEEKGNSKEKNKKSKMKFNSITVPVGHYKLVGGLVSRNTKSMKWESFVSFVGGKPIKVEEGKTFNITLGKPLTGTFGLTADGEERVVSLNFIKGAFGEQYKFFAPLVEEANLEIKGKPGMPFERGTRKVMGLAPKKPYFMDTFVRYDPVMFPPENGPFMFSLKINPLIFSTQTFTTERPTMEADKKPKKSKPKPKPKAKPKAKKPAEKKK